MTPRITAARLAEIESAAGWEYGNPAIRLVYRELLAELREVTRERDEARATVKRLQEAYLPGRWEKLREIEQERDKLKQELADLNYKAGNEYAIVMHYKGEMDALRAENARLKDPEQNEEWLTLARDHERLRAELAKYKAVADAARPACERYFQFDRSMKAEIEALQMALAALDRKEGA